jgi:hypothetical protein
MFNEMVSTPSLVFLTTLTLNRISKRSWLEPKNFVTFVDVVDAIEEDFEGGIVLDVLVDLQIVVEGFRGMLVDEVLCDRGSVDPDHNAPSLVNGFNLCREPYVCDHDVGGLVALKELGHPDHIQVGACLLCKGWVDFTQVLEKLVPKVLHCDPRTDAPLGIDLLLLFRVLNEGLIPAEDCLGSLLGGPATLYRVKLKLAQR